MLCEKGGYQLVSSHSIRKKQYEVKHLLLDSIFVNNIVLDIVFKKAKLPLILDFHKKLIRAGKHVIGH
jgi:hypothetical protein